MSEESSGNGKCFEKNKHWKFALIVELFQYHCHCLVMKYGKASDWMKICLCHKNKLHLTNHHHKKEYVCEGQK